MVSKCHIVLRISTRSTGQRMSVGLVYMNDVMKMCAKDNNYHGKKSLAI